jgi:hypothetical protein
MQAGSQCPRESTQYLDPNLLDPRGSLSWRASRAGRGPTLLRHPRGSGSCRAPQARDCGRIPRAAAVGAPGPAPLLPRARPRRQCSRGPPPRPRRRPRSCSQRAPMRPAARRAPRPAGAPARWGLRAWGLRGLRTRTRGVLRWRCGAIGRTPRRRRMRPELRAEGEGASGRLGVAAGGGKREEEVFFLVQLALPLV